MGIFLCFFLVVVGTFQGVCFPGSCLDVINFAKNLHLFFGPGFGGIFFPRQELVHHPFLIAKH